MLNQEAHPAHDCGMANIQRFNNILARFPLPEEPDSTKARTNVFRRIFVPEFVKKLRIWCQGGEFVGNFVWFSHHPTFYQSVSGHASDQHDSRPCPICQISLGREMRAKRKGESSSAMIPESLTTCSTPAFLAASMKFDCTSSIAGSEDEISMARSTPRSASASVSGRAMSPSTISTFGREENSSALAALRTSARTGTPFADRRRTNARPFNPVAPVTRIIP